MSVIVNTNNSLIFGNQSPFFRVVTESGLKEKFLHMLVDKSTVVYRKRAWDTYKLANQIFPAKVAEVNDNVKYGIGKLLSPFITNSVQQVETLVLKAPRQKYVNGEVELTNELVKATGIKNTLVMVVDSDREPLVSCHGMITYITRDITKGKCEQLNAGWTNKFFSFNDAANLSMLIMIPKQYIASLITHELTTLNPGIGISDMDLLATKGKLVDAFTMDLIKSIFSAIYGDGIKTRITSDILLYNSLVQKEGNYINSSVDVTGDKNKASEIFSKYAVDLKQFKSSTNSEHIVYELLDLVKFTAKAQINPLEFYNGFIDVPYCQIENVFGKIPVLARFDNGRVSNYNFSNNLSEMDMFNPEKDRDIISYGIKLIRYLPWLLFNTYVIGNGSLHLECKNLIGNLKSYVTSLLGFKSSNYSAAPIANFIADNLNYIINVLSKEMSSPLTVTENTRNALRVAIDTYGMVEDEDDGSANDSTIGRMMQTITNIL